MNSSGSAKCQLPSQKGCTILPLPSETLLPLGVGRIHVWVWKGYEWVMRAEYINYITSWSQSSQWHLCYDIKRSGRKYSPGSFRGSTNLVLKVGTNTRSSTWELARKANYPKLAKFVTLWIVWIWTFSWTEMPLNLGTTDVLKFRKKI